MKTMYRKASIVLYACLLSLAPLTLRAQAGPCPNGQQIAFPGAEGFGRCTQGGRGGRVMEVTNLNDWGPGTLRECAEGSGPRTCVFRIGGTIQLENIIRVTEPYLTIAGQTAPGGGITLKDGHISVRANHVIIRHIRVRPGLAPLFERDQNAQGIEVRSNEGVPINNVIVDHCSFGWTTDDMLQFVFGSDLVTFQWNILSEGLFSAAHAYIDGKGMLIGSGAKRGTVHHNLFAQTTIRQPEIQQGDVDVVNNVSYDNNGQDVDAYAYFGPIHANLVGNYYKNGPTTWYPTHRSIRITTNSSAYGHQSTFYVFGNIGPTRPTDDLPQTQIVNQNDGAAPFIQTRHDYPLVQTTDAFTAYQDVLAKAGARVPMLDAVDVRVLNNVRNGTSSTRPLEAPESPDDVGGWPVLAAGTPPADSDHDGMPDSWESAKGLNPSNASDGPQDRNGDGYTNLEDYLNELAGGGSAPPPPPGPVPPPPPPAPVPAPPPAGNYSLNVTPLSVAPGAPLTVSFTAPSSHPATDWIGLYPVNAPDDDSQLISYQYVPAGSSGSLTFSASSSAANIHLRYYTDNSHNRAATSQTVAVMGGGSQTTDLNGDGMTNVADVQLGVNQALGIAACTNGNVDGNPGCTVTDVQGIVNAALGT